jgi:hypothetical protein
MAGGTFRRATRITGPAATVTTTASPAKADAARDMLWLTNWVA